jgi:hypothetical protein
MSESPPAVAVEDLYRHPAVQGGPREDSRGFGFKKQHDIYALGIILIEIVYWKPIHTILGFENSQAVRPREAAGVKEKLLHGPYGDYLKSNAGDIVTDVTMACISGPAAFGVVDSFHKSGKNSGAKFQEKFFEVVVQQLRELRV